MSAESLLADLVRDNLHLQSNSPYINAGNNAYALGSTDLDENLRILTGFRWMNRGPSHNLLAPLTNAFSLPFSFPFFALRYGRSKMP